MVNLFRKFEIISVLLTVAMNDIVHDLVVLLQPLSSTDIYLISSLVQ